MTFTLHLSRNLCLSTEAAKFALQHGAIQHVIASCKGPIGLGILTKSDSNVLIKITC